MDVYGVKLIGIDAHTGEKLLLSLVLFLGLLIVRPVLRAATDLLFAGNRLHRFRFWTRQTINITTTVLFAIAFLSIWFDNPRNLATAIGLVTAGLAFALQNVVTAIAGYLVILRGKTFNVGDRIVLGGVRGDVIALGFIQTTIMEMGQLPPVQNASVRDLCRSTKRGASCRSRQSARLEPASEQRRLRASDPCRLQFGVVNVLWGQSNFIKQWL